MIKNYNKFNESLNFPNTKEEIHKLCTKYSIRRYTINKDDMSISVNDNVDLTFSKLDRLPLKFRKINSCFEIQRNNIESLEGCPISVNSWFDCSYNNISSLEGMPKFIKEDIYINSNNIKNLKGFPEDWVGHISYSNNPIAHVLYLFDSVDVIKAINLINEFDVIQGDNIIMDRLEEVFIQLSLKPFDIEDIEEIKGYNLI